MCVQKGEKDETTMRRVLKEFTACAREVLKPANWEMWIESWLNKRKFGEVMSKKPLGRKSYGSIPHLPNKVDGSDLPQMSQEAVWNMSILDETLRAAKKADKSNDTFIKTAFAGIPVRVDKTLDGMQYYLCVSQELFNKLQEKPSGDSSS